MRTGSSLDAPPPMSDDLAEYIADHYGRCDREADCYHGKDGDGRFDGCLQVGWRGRSCHHWHPVAARTWDELKDEVGRP